MPARRRRLLAAAAVPVVAAAAFAAVQYGSASAVTPAPPVSPSSASAVGPSAPAPATPTEDAAPTASASSSAPAPAATPPRTSAPATRSPAPTTPPAPAGPGTPAVPLPAAQLPNAAKAAWKPLGTPSPRPVGQTIGLNECTGVDGVTAWFQQGWVSTARTPAIQDTFTFATSAAARQAYEKADADMKNCSGRLRALQERNGLTPDASAHSTVTVENASAWRYGWNAVPGMSAPGPQVHHVYLALNGSELTVLQYSDLASAGQSDTATPASDEQFLATLTRHLRTAR
ncbi:hypothetical protein ACWD4X_28550 [Streptomyces termitum]